MAFVVAATLFAHTMIEPPQQIWGTWADNVSRPAPLAAGRSVSHSSPR